RPEAISTRERAELEHLYSKKIEDFLNAGKGACLMREPSIGRIVNDAIYHFDGERYVIHASVVMPNHVHVLVQPANGHSLESILHSWESFTAHEMNDQLNRSGEVWQVEYFDHVVRDRNDYDGQIRYIRENPDRAGLHNWPWTRVSDGDQARAMAGTAMVH